MNNSNNLNGKLNFQEACQNDKISNDTTPGQNYGKESIGPDTGNNDGGSDNVPPRPNNVPPRPNNVPPRPNVTPPRRTPQEEQLLLEDLSRDYAESVSFWNKGFLAMLCVCAALTMMTLWWWSRQHWWIPALAALVTATLCYITLQDIPGTPRRVPSGIAGTMTDGEPRIRGLNRFNILVVFLIACCWIAIPHFVSYAVLELVPDSYAVFALLRLLAKVIAGMAYLITVLCVVNFICRLVETFYRPIPENRYTARWLRPMIPCLRSDVRHIGDFLDDLLGWLIMMIAVAAFTVFMWVGLTLVFDRPLLQKKYHYWPFRPDKELVIPEHRTFEETKDGTTAAEPSTIGGKNSTDKDQKDKTAKKKGNIKSMAFQEKSIWMHVGEKRQYHLIVNPTHHIETINIVAPLDAQQQIVLQLSGNHTITAVKEGECLIMAESSLSHHTAQLMVHVTP